jgi:TPR repeat protein
MNATFLRGPVLMLGLLLGLLLPIAGCSSSASKSLAAAERGDTRTQLEPGTLYARGKRVDRNDIEAAKWLRKAADQGLPQAQLNLGLAYDLGLGVTVDKAEAESWWEMAAEQGDTGAAKNLVQLRAQRWTPPPCADNGIPRAWQCRTMPQRLSPRP